MKRMLAACLGLCCASASLRAGPTEEAIIAVMRLSAEPNYSWIATVADDARTYDIEGRTVRGGFTRVRMPVINSVRRKLGRSVTDTQIELVFRGNVACVIETEAGWKKPGELPAPDPEDYELGHMPGSTGHAPIFGVKGGSGSVLRGSIMGPPASKGKAPEGPQAYSNLQLGISHPHEDLGVIVSSHQNFKVEGEVASGTLTELGAQLLLVRDGQDQITPVRAAGTFKIWLRGGAVIKYQVQLEGILSVSGPAGRREISVQQTTNTLLKNVGTTTVEVPDEARRKLSV